MKNMVFIMAIDIKSPQFPESIFEGTLSSWLKKEGQEIKQDEVLAEIETDKVVIEVTAPSDGVMEKIIIDEGATIKSSEIIGTYDDVKGSKPSKVVKEEKVEEKIRMLKKERNRLRAGAQRRDPKPKRMKLDEGVEEREMKR